MLCSVFLLVSFQFSSSDCWMGWRLSTKWGFFYEFISIWFCRLKVPILKMEPFVMVTMDS
ncbi:hypothetical protein HanHA300_Chr13g0479981 [Helianthus annuus]|nr:hypothetical protein HanHA300_Chr13g0479981 [Helianthus annuus]